MGSIIRDRGYLAVQFYLERIRHREHLGLKDTRDNWREAERRLKEIEREIRLGTFDYAKAFPDSRTVRQRELVKLATAPLTLGQHARLWLEDQAATEGYTQRVVQDYEYLFRVFLDRTSLGAMMPAQVTRHHIRKAIAGRSKRRSTMFLQRLRVIFDELVEDGHASGNPARSVKNPRRRKRQEQQFREGLTPAGQVAVLNAATGQDRNITRLGFATGMRPDSELLSVHTADLNFDTLELTVRGTKNEGAARVIELHRLPADLKAQVLTAFRDQLQLRAGRRPAKVRWLPDQRRAKAQGGELLFVGTRGGRLNYTNWRGRHWNAIVARAGFAPAGHQEHPTPYGMRHTFAKTLLNAGVELETAWKLLGHTGPEMLLRVYGRAKPKQAALES